MHSEKNRSEGREGTEHRDRVHVRLERLRGRNRRVDGDRRRSAARRSLQHEATTPMSATTSRIAMTVSQLLATLPHASHPSMLM